MTFSAAILANFFILLAITLGLWLLSVKLRDASIVDIFWGFGFVVIAAISLWQSGQLNGRNILITTCTVAWGLRLGLYLAWRNNGKGEDFRYAAMREKHGGRFAVLSLFSVFWLQAVIMWMVSLPVQAAQFSTSPLGLLDGIGAAICLTGWLFESIGDWQLARFKAEPANRGQVLDRGLWKYTRHPNYFGDFLVWWGLFVIAASGGSGWTIFSPAIMSFFLMRVSGVPMLERSLKQRRPEYASYIEQTNAFFPWFPRNGESTSRQPVE